MSIIKSNRDVDGKTDVYGITPFHLTDLAEVANMPFKNIVRYDLASIILKVDLKSVSKNVAYVDPSFTEMFTVNKSYGSDAINDINSIILTKSTAISIFGTENAVGEQIQFKNSKGSFESLSVTGIIDDLELNRSLRFDAIMHIEKRFPPVLNDNNPWTSMVDATFIQVENKHKNETQKMLSRFCEEQNKARPDWIIKSFELEPLIDVGIKGRNVISYRQTLNLHPIQAVAINVLAILILISASINFVNSTISIFSKHITEIGIRKVMGSSKQQLIKRFIIQNVLICIPIIILGLAIGIALVKLYSGMWWFMSIRVDLMSIQLFIFLSVLLILIAFSTGFYPSVYVGSFSPVSILRNNLKLKGPNLFSTSIMVIQFTMCIAILVISFGLLQNGNFLGKFSVGYNFDDIIVVPIEPDSFEKYKNEIVTNPSIEEVAGTENQISYSRKTLPISYLTKRLETRVYDIGDNYFSAMDIDIIEGRNFNKQLESDIVDKVIVSKAFAEIFDIEDPLNKVITIENKRYTIIGVSNEIYQFGIFRETDAKVFRLVNQAQFKNLVVRAKPGLSADINSYLESKWNNFFPDNPYAGYFQERISGASFRVNDRGTKIFIFLSFVSLFLSIAGLYSMVAIVLDRKRKEISIRKVLGAWKSSLYYVVSFRIIVGAMCAIMVGGLSGFYFLNILLKGIFKVFFDPNLFTVFAPVFLFAIILLLVIFLKTERSINKNAVDELRSQ